MRVIIELSRFDKGGLERVVLDSALAFRAAGLEVVIVSIAGLGHLAAQAREAGLEVVALPAGRVEASYEALLRRFEPHLAISHFSDVGYPLFARRGIPNLTVIHNVYAFLDAAGRARLRANDPLVARYIAVFDQAARYAIGALGLPAGKVAIIPNGLNIAEHSARSARPQRLTRAELGLEASDYVFLHPASYNLHKGHYLIAAALGLVLERRSDIKVLCAGHPVHAPHLEALRAHIRAQGLERHMLLPGHFAEIEQPFRLADACLLPSFIEGWSIAVNEAMFYGKPLILTDTGGAAQVIEGGDTGILLPPEYPDLLALDSATLDALAYAPRPYRLAEPLAAAMMNFADHPARWAEAGARGRAKLLARHDFNQVVQAYLAEMRALAAA